MLKYIFFFCLTDYADSWYFKKKIKPNLDINCFTNLDCGKNGRCDREVTITLPNFPLTKPTLRNTPLPNPLPTPLPTSIPTTLPTLSPTFSVTKSPTKFPSINKLENLREEILLLVNNERDKIGLPPLCRNKKLDEIALLHSLDLDLCRTLSHSSCDGRTLTDRLNSISYQYDNAGENVAWNQRTSQQVMNSWMNSPGHRENILNSKFKNIGIGLSNNYYWTQVFGTLYSGDNGCDEIEIRSIDVNIKKQCICYKGYFTLNKNDICGYKVKSLVLAYILSLLLPPFGVSYFYMGWYIIASFNLIFGILSLVYYFYFNYQPNKYFNSNITFYLLNLIWLVFWLIGIILLSTNPIDNNNVKAI